jgi:hypothetical protein
MLNHLCGCVKITRHNLSDNLLGLLEVFEKKRSERMFKNGFLHLNDSKKILNLLRNVRT